MVTQVLKKIATKWKYLHQQGRVWIITFHFAYCEVNLNFLEKKMWKNKHLCEYGNFCRFSFTQKLELSINWVRSPQSTPVPMYLPLNTFMSTIMTGYLFLTELLDLVGFATISLLLISNQLTFTVLKIRVSQWLMAVEISVLTASKFWRK